MCPRFVPAQVRKVAMRGRKGVVVVVVIVGGDWKKDSDDACGGVSPCVSRLTFD